MPRADAPTLDVDAGRLSLTAQDQERLRGVLAARPRALLTDVDGTLAAIAPTPAEARLLPGVEPLLVRACSTFDLVVAVSGRSARDARRLVGLPGLMYVGNHGLERIAPGPSDIRGGVRAEVLPAARRYIPIINRVMDRAFAELHQDFAGIQVERKGATGSIHVRNANDPEAAQRAVLAVLERLTKETGLRITQGKMVVELRPPLAVNKGTIVAELVRSHGLKGALYLGDDTTDIDAFRALRRLATEGTCAGVAVAIMHPEAPAGLSEEADITLPSIEQVPHLLRWLLDNA